MSDAGLIATLRASPGTARDGRDDRHWLLRFARVWYGTHQLKLRRRREHLSDAQYYRLAFAVDPVAAAAKGDKFASTRTAVTRGIRQDRRTARVLDLGTGLGFQARSIWDAGYRQVYACDLVPDRIAIARTLHARTAIKFMMGDMQTLGFPDRSLDAITISVALHDLAAVGVEMVLAECERTLVPGGRLVVLEPRWQRDLASAPHRWVYRFCGRLLDESVHLDDFLRFDLAGRLTPRGFTLVSRAVVWHSVLCLYTFEKAR
jgi:SAM-dependent methyltransferase